MFPTSVLAALRWLLLAEFAALFISTSLTTIFEVLLFGTFLIGFVSLRPQLRLLLRQPVLMASLVFFALLCLGLLYGSAPFAERLDTLKSWRKLLLLPLALLAFAQTEAKLRLSWTLVGLATIAALLSFVGLFGFSPTIVVHNHATQGIFFATGAFAAILLFLDPISRSLPPILRRALPLCVLLLAVNVLFVCPGRSGYLALLVLSMVACFSRFPGRYRIGVSAAAGAVLLGLLFLSPVARERLELAVSEIQGYRQAEEYSSMGIRMVMWENTVKLIAERPLFGHGLGGMREAYRRQVEGVAGWRGIVVDDPHNQYLLITAELGLVGLLAFLGLIGSFYLQKAAEPHRTLGLGLLLAIAATSLFNGHFNTWGEGRFLLIWCGGQLAALLPDQGREGEANTGERCASL